MTQHSEHTNNKRKLHVWVQTSNKSDWKSRKSCNGPTKGAKLLSGFPSYSVDVIVRRNIKRTMSNSAKTWISNSEYEGTQQVLHQNYLHMHHVSMNGIVGFTAECQLWPLAKLDYDNVSNVSLLSRLPTRECTRVHLASHNSIHHYGSSLIFLREAIHSTHSYLEYFRISI